MSNISVFLAVFNKEDFILDVLQGVCAEEMYNDKVVLTAFIAEVSSKTYDNPQQEITDEVFLKACRTSTWGQIYYVAKRLTELAYRNYIPKIETI